MLTVYGEGRGFRVIWLLEELGLAYRLRPVDLLAVENDRDFLAINPAGFIPALQDGETIMVEIDRDSSVPARPPRLRFACRRPGRSRLRFLSAISPLGRGRARRADERRLCRSRTGARSRARCPGYLLGTRDLREPAGVGYPPPRGLPLSRRRPLHCCRYLSELRPAARPANRQLRPRFYRAGLSRPHDRTPCLRPSDGKLPGHQGLGGEITGIVVLASSERPSARLSSCEKFLMGVYQLGVWLPACTEL